MKFNTFKIEKNKFSYILNNLRNFKLTIFSFIIVLFIDIVSFYYVDATLYAFWSIFIVVFVSIFLYEGYIYIVNRRYK